MKKIKLLPSQKIIPCEEGETILSALESNGLMLPNNCRAGACGECKIKVKSGKYDQGFILNMALSAKEKEEGFGLMCVAKPIDDLIEIEWGEVNIRPKFFDAEENKPFCVIEKRKITKTITKLVLRSLGKPLRFWPGQYIKLKDENSNVKEAVYSIANISNQEGMIELLIEKTPDGKNNQWIEQQLKEGDNCLVSGAYGEFIGHPDIEKPVLCIGEGVGMAPLMSLAQGAMIRGGFKKIVKIIEVAKDRDQLIAFAHLTFLEKKFRKFNYLVFAKNEKNDFGLSDFLKDNHLTSLSDYAIYIAGRKEFIEQTSEVLKINGADSNHLFIEDFNF